VCSIAVRQQEVVDTLTGWPPESVRVLSITERQAYDLLRRAMPGFLVMAQVPLARFIRVPSRRSYTEWLQRVGSLSADLLLCDSGSRVLAVIDIRNAAGNRTQPPPPRTHGACAACRAHPGLRVARRPVAHRRRGAALSPLLGPAAAGIKPTARGRCR
jgi:hypothetical protein